MIGFTKKIIMQSMLKSTTSSLYKTLPCYSFSAENNTQNPTTKYAAVIEYLQDKELVAKIRPIHREYMANLQKNNKLFAAGPFLDDFGALIIYEEQSVEAVEALIKADPFFEAKVFQKWTIKPWKLVFFNHKLV